VTISWKDNCDPVEVASRIEESRRSSKGETVNFGAQFSRHVILLHSMLNFPDAIPEVEARGIARCAAFQAAHGGPITAKTLLAEANKLTDEYTGRPLERYVLVTALTYQPSSPMKGIRMGDTVILFERTLHSRFQAARMKLASEARLSLSIPATTTVPAASARVHVWARTSNEAADKAIDAVDLVRGIWNWSLNRQRPMRWSTGKRSPVNRLLLGPIHTLHRMSGALATQSWWYEPEWYVDPFGGGVFPEEDIEQMYAFFGKTRRRLARCSYRDAIEQAILRYTRALDMTN
jgi:hypothetical protein